MGKTGASFQFSAARILHSAASFPKTGDRFPRAGGSLRQSSASARFSGGSLPHSGGSFENSGGGMRDSGKGFRRSGGGFGVVVFCIRKPQSHKPRSSFPDFLASKFRRDRNARGAARSTGGSKLDFCQTPLFRWDAPTLRRSDAPTLRWLRVQMCFPFEGEPRSSGADENDPLVIWQAEFRHAASHSGNSAQSSPYCKPETAATIARPSAPQRSAAMHVADFPRKVAPCMEQVRRVDGAGCRP